MNDTTIHKQTVNRGIDYGRGSTNIDKETGIRYGVISQHSIMSEAFDDVWQDARDLTWETAVAEAKQQLAACETDEEIAEFLLEHFTSRQIEYTGTIELTGDADARWAQVEDCFNDNYNDGGDRDWLYERDGYKLANCQSDVMVLASPYYTYAQLCSPCVPGACNLNAPLHLNTDASEVHCICRNHGIPKAYCLGHDWFEGGRAPYPVYSVATGELVAP